MKYTLRVLRNLAAVSCGPDIVMHFPSLDTAIRVGLEIETIWAQMHQWESHQWDVVGLRPFIRYSSCMTNPLSRHYCQEEAQ